MLISAIVHRSDFIIGLSIALVGLILALALGFWIFKSRATQKYNSELKMTRSPSRDYFTFLKKNFSVFLVLFFAVMAITGLAMVVTSLG